jgi:hypothetical protein
MKGEMKPCNVKEGLKEKFQAHRCIVLQPIFESGILKRR